MEHIYQVSELGGLIKRTLEQLAPRIRIQGEISDPMVSSKGYFYATLKDDKSTINMAYFAPQRFGFKPQHGQQVIVTGKLTAYPQRSQYQFLIESIELAGVGAILQAIEERKRRLHLEGLFDEAKKKPLPVMPRRIAVITSPTGAVIRDIIHRLAARFPLAVHIWPVNVQGDLAVPQIIAALEGIREALHLPQPDLVIIARGGGSIEDLMPFNDEGLVRAVFAFQIPVISAIGHETDTTLIDHVADLRAPTPTAAAELATPVRSDLLQALVQHGQRVTVGLHRAIETAKARYFQQAERLPQLLPRRVQDQAQYLDQLQMQLGKGLESWKQKRSNTLQLLNAKLQAAKPQLKAPATQLQQIDYRLKQALPMHLKRQQQRVQNTQQQLLAARPNTQLRQVKLQQLEQRIGCVLPNRLQRNHNLLISLKEQLNALGPYQVLQRGYTITETADGQVLAFAAQTKPGMQLKTRFADGEVESIVN